jgi:hypothetical protein
VQSDFTGLTGEADRPRAISNANASWAPGSYLELGRPVFFIRIYQGVMVGLGNIFSFIGQAEAEQIHVLAQM